MGSLGHLNKYIKHRTTVIGQLTIAAGLLWRPLITLKNPPAAAVAVSVFEKTELTAVEIGERLADLLLRVHDEWPVLNHRFVDGFAIQQQKMRLRLRLDENVFAIIFEQDEIKPASFGFAIDLRIPR